MVEISLDAGVAAGISAGIVGSFGWLGQKLWGFYRSEIHNLRDDTNKVSISLQEHVKSDEALHRELSGHMQYFRGVVEQRFGSGNVSKADRHET